MAFLAFLAFLPLLDLLAFFAAALSADGTAAGVGCTAGAAGAIGAAGAAGAAGAWARTREVARMLSTEANVFFMVCGLVMTSEVEVCAARAACQQGRLIVKRRAGFAR